MILSEVLVDGEPSDGRLDVSDSSVLRGDGCFEVVRVYRGIAFEARRHLERLARSASAMELDLPPLSEIEGWVRQLAAGRDQCLVRIVVTRGSALAPDTARSQAIAFAHGLTPPARTARLFPVEAPWHPGGAGWALSGAKTLSYAPNLGATRVARAAGFDDAILISRDGFALEGPTFSLAWVVDGIIETPTLDLGILASITREVIIEEAARAGLTVEEGAWPVERLARASEVMAISTVREVQPVVAVGEQREFEPGEVTALLSDRYRQRVG